MQADRRHIFQENLTSLVAESDVDAESGRAGLSAAVVRLVELFSDWARFMLTVVFKTSAADGIFGIRIPAAAVPDDVEPRRVGAPLGKGIKEP